MHTIDCESLVESLELISIDAEDIHIDVDRLHSLYLDNICGFKRVFINSPYLHDFTVINSIPAENYYRPLMPKEILWSCCSIVPVQINGAMSRPRLIEAVHYGFERVLSTELGLTPSQDATLLSEIFRICRNLIELHINSEGYKGENELINYLSYPKAELWAKKEVFDSIKFTLNSFHIRGFKGTILELELVKYIEKHATKLQELLVLQKQQIR